MNYDAGSGPDSVAVGDFNGDGKPDLAVANYGDGTVSVLLGNGDGTFQAAVSYGAGSGPASVAVGDFNGDGKADLVVANSTDGTVSVLLGNGDGTFQAAVNYGAGSGPASVAVGDFNGDGKADLVVGNCNDGVVSVLLGNGDGTFQAAVSYGTGSGPASVAVGDFNGDGKADLAVATYTDGTVSVLLGNGDGTFQAAVSYGTGSNPASVAVGDFNGDGKADLAVANYGDGTVSLLLGNGDGTFQAAVNYGTGSNPASVAVGDFNGDGEADLAVANYNDGTVSVLLGYGDGTFQAAVNYGTGSNPASVAVGDFNGDGKPDLAVANGGNNSVSILLNTTAYLLPAIVESPAPNSTLTGSSVTFQWTPSDPATAYWIDVGSVAGGNQYYQSGSLSTNTREATVSGLPGDGSTIYVTMYSLISGQWIYNQYTYTAYSKANNKGVVTTPTPGSTLSGSSVTFNWTAGTGATAYWLDVGSTPGGNQYYQSGNLGNVLTTTANGLPTDGSTVYATLYSLVSGQWLSNAYTYTAYSASGVQGVLTTPTPGSTLGGSSVTFDWTAGTGATAYWLDIGSTPGGNQYYQSGNLGNVLTTTANGLPTDGSTVYATLYSLVSGQWLSNAYTYTAFSASGVQGVLTTPTPGSTLSGSSVTFDWTAGTGATAYWLDVGSTPGGNQYYQSGNLGNVLTTTANGLPTDGSTVYATLYSLVSGQWLSNVYTYTAYSASGVQGVLTTPTPGSTLSGSSVTFDWTAGTGATAYWLDVGSTPGGNQYYQSGNLGNVLTVTVNGLPTNGGTVYVTLYSLVGGQWLNNAYTYKAYNSSVVGLIIGHSDAASEYGNVARDFPQIPNWFVVSHYSLDCAQLTQLLPYDLKLAPVPDFVIVHLGTTDAEPHGPVGQRVNTPAADFMACAEGYISTLLARFPQTKIIFPTTEPFNVATLDPPSEYNDTRPWVAAYNSAETDPNTGLEAQFPGQVWVVDAHDVVVDASGWAIATYIPYIDPDPAGWTVIDANIQPVLAQLGLAL